MADAASRSTSATPTFKRSRIKPEIYQTTNGKVIVEDELLHFLSTRIKTLSQDEIVLLAINTFDTEGIEESKKVLFEVCPDTSQRNVAHKGQQKDTNNIKLCLRVLNECGLNIPRFVSYYLEDLPPVSFTSIDTTCVLKRMEQLFTEVCSLKRATELHTEVCEQINDRVAALEHRPERDAGSLEQGPAPAKRKRSEACDFGETPAARATEQCYTTSEHRPERAAGSEDPGLEPAMLTRSENTSSGERPEASATEQQVAAVVHRPVPAAGHDEWPGSRTPGQTPAGLSAAAEAVGRVSSSHGRERTAASPSYSLVVRKGWPRPGSGNAAAHSRQRITGNTSGGAKRHGVAPIVGTSAVSTIKTVQTKLVSVFATKFCPELDADTLSVYLRAKLNRAATCHKIDSVQSRFSSFKVTAECKEVGEMYAPELWPKGAFIRRYYEPRKAGTPGAPARINIPSVQASNNVLNANGPTADSLNSYACWIL